MSWALKNKIFIETGRFILIGLIIIFIIPMLIIELMYEVFKYD